MPYNPFAPKPLQWEHIPNFMSPNPRPSYGERLDEYNAKSKPSSAFPGWSFPPPAPPDNSTQDDPSPPVPSASACISESSSSLANAFVEPVEAAPRPPRTEPPSWYNPYPYPRNWTLDQKVTGKDLWVWHHREDDWTRDSHGSYIVEIKNAVWNVYTMGILARQKAARAAWEDRMLLTNPPMVPKRKGSGVSHSRDVYFQTFDRDKGIPVKAIIAGRRELQHLLRDANKTPFKGLRYDTVKVRMKWPAYPDYEPDRQIFVTMRTGKSKVKRRPITRMEFLVSLGSFFTQYYAEVSKMEPHPGFAHLALGPGEGKISLYALRLMGMRAGTGGCFDIDLELDTVQPRANSDEEAEDDTHACLATPALDPLSTVAPVDNSSASPSTPGLSTTSEANTDRDPDDGAKTPPWASTLPVTCTVGPPPQIPHQNYFTHVDPLKLREYALPAWPDVYGRR